jgi:TetR/AcrR family transcriptional regulator, repressor for uid operon
MSARFYQHVGAGSMPKLAPATYKLRREHILNCAEICFVQKGFHAATVDDIRREAGLSIGCVYGHFPSKEELIAGLCRRETDRFGAQLAQVGEARDFLAALQSMAEHFCEEPIEKVRLHTEIAAEAGRNEQVRQTVQEMDKIFRSSFALLLERERACGRIRPHLPIEIIVQAISALGDGLFTRRVRHPNLDMKPIVAAIMAMILALLIPD